MDREIYENMSLEEITEIYECMKKSISPCFISYDNPSKIYKWEDDDVMDVFMDAKYVRESTEFERTIYEIYWDKMERE